jgi:RNA polymerase sigma factor (TIGR02999 family)
MDDGDITRELVAVREGEAGAMDRLFELVYDRLRGMARGRLGGGPKLTLDTNVMVHEAYLKFVRQGEVDLRDRNHFFAVAARAMRQILVDHVRRDRAAKRWGGLERTGLTAADIGLDDRIVELLELDAALDRLATMNERLCRIVELKFFAGLSFEEIAGAIGVTERTVYRDWRNARAFLASELKPSS